MLNLKKLNFINLVVNKMKFNKSFKTSSKFSEKEIALIEKLLGVTLPTELKFFYQVYGGIKLEEPVKSAYYITLDEKKGITPLLAFFDYQELILEIDYFKEDAGVEDIAPLNEFVPIALCSWTISHSYGA